MFRFFVMFLLLVAANVGASDKITVVLDWFLNPNHALLVLAEQKGYFKAHDLEIEFVPQYNPAVALQTLLNRKQNLVVTYQSSYIKTLATKNFPITQVSTLLNGPLGCVIALQDSGVTRFTDLVGKNIGISTADEAFMLQIMLQHAQPKAEKKLTTTLLSSNNIVAQLLSGKVAAISGGYRNYEVHLLAKYKKKLVVFYPEDYGFPRHDELVVVARNSVKTEVVRNFNRALQDAAYYIHYNSKQAFEDFMLYLASHNNYIQAKNTTENHKLLQKSWASTVSYVPFKPAVFNALRYKKYYKFLKDNNFIAP